LGANQVHIEVDRAVEFKKQIILCRKSNVDEKGIDMAFPILSSLQRIDFGNEYELADNVIGTILEREIDLRYSFGLGTYYYEIEKIGEGSFSMVYKAKRKNDNEVVALSIIHRLDKDTREWLIKSISAWTSLKHRNIVRLYDVGISPFFYLEQEFCEKSLAEYNFPLPINNAIKYVVGICDGLDYAHKKGIIHGDLKPDNILIKNNIPKISDWGLSKALGDDATATITPIAFTPMYAAPEQLSLSKIDMRTDLYQLGTIFYEMVTAKKPYYLSESFLSDETVILSPSIRSIIEAKTCGKLVPPSTINPNARLVEPIIMKLLEYNKEDRYPSAAELKKDLKLTISKKYTGTT
jgi:serine/threonine protein kinase